MKKFCYKHHKYATRQARVGLNENRSKYQNERKVYCEMLAWISKID